MPNCISKVIEEGILKFCFQYPSYGAAKDRPRIKIKTENLREPLENRLNPLIYKAHKEFNFSPQR